MESGAPAGRSARLESRVVLGWVRGRSGLGHSASTTGLAALPTWLFSRQVGRGSKRFKKSAQLRTEKKTLESIPYMNAKAHPQAVVSLWLEEKMERVCELNTSEEAKLEEAQYHSLHGYHLLWTQSALLGKHCWAGHFHWSSLYTWTTCIQKEHCNKCGHVHLVDIQR